MGRKMARNPTHVDGPPNSPPQPLGRENAPHLPTPQTTTNNANNNQTTVQFSRLTISTLYRIITGHTFVGKYTQRFFPQHTPEQIAFPCGKPVQSIEHVIMECPIYNAARRKHLTPMLPTAFHPPTTGTRPAPASGGHRHLRKATGDLGSGIRKQHESRGRNIPHRTNPHDHPTLQSYSTHDQLTLAQYNNPHA